MSTTQLMLLIDAISNFDQRDIAHLRTQLRAFPAVRDAAVALRTDRPSGRQLVAFLLSGAPLPLADVRAQLTRTVPPSLMPATFITVDALPQLANGEPDLAALPAPDTAALGLRQYETPDGPVEKAIALMWQDLLGVEPVGRQAHFFELGGHSALAVELIHRVRRQMTIDVMMRDLFVAPTLQAFSAHVASCIRLPADRLAALA